MCHYIYLVLPVQADADALRGIVERHRRVLTPAVEGLVCRELAADQRAYLTTATCDCGTTLVAQESTGRDDHPERDVARLRKQGWSEAKILRWREQRGEVAVRKADAAEKTRAHEVEEWRALLGELLDAAAGRVGLLVHLDGGGVSRGPVVPRRVLAADGLERLEQNVLYTFTR